MKNKSVLKITNSTPRRIHLKRGTHKSHPLGFPLYSGFSSYIYICIYTHMCRYIGVDRGRYTNSLVPPLSVSVYHCQGNVAKFRCNNGSLFSRGRQPRFLFGDPAKSTSPRNEGEGEETWPSKRNGGKRERERKSLSTKEEGFRYGLPRCLHWHAINGLRNSHEARYGPTKGRNSIRGPTFRQDRRYFVHRVEIRGNPFLKIVSQ